MQLDVCFIISNTEILKSIYFAYFHSIMKCEIIFWGNSSHTSQKKIDRLMARVKPRNSCKNLFKRLEILTLAYECMFILMTFIAKKQDMFPTNSRIHTVITKNKNQDQLPNSSCFQKSAYYAGIKIFNSLASNLTTLIDKQTQFKVALKKYLITHTHTPFTLLMNLFFQITQNVCNVFLLS
jgi:hypothetical protein